MAPAYPWLMSQGLQQGRSMNGSSAESLPTSSRALLVAITFIVSIGLLFVIIIAG
jgi:hypothetical protein